MAKVPKHMAPPRPSVGALPIAVYPPENISWPQPLFFGDRCVAEVFCESVTNPSGTITVTFKVKAC